MNPRPPRRWVATLSVESLNLLQLTQSVGLELSCRSKHFLWIDVVLSIYIIKSERSFLLYIMFSVFYIFFVWNFLSSDPKPRRSQLVSYLSGAYFSVTTSNLGSFFLWFLSLEYPPPLLVELRPLLPTFFFCITISWQTCYWWERHVLDSWNEGRNRCCEILPSMEWALDKSAFFLLNFDQLERLRKFPTVRPFETLQLVSYTRRFHFQLLSRANDLSNFSYRFSWISTPPLILNGISG